MKVLEETKTLIARENHCKRMGRKKESTIKMELDYNDYYCSTFGTWPMLYTSTYLHFIISFLLYMISLMALCCSLRLSIRLSF